MAERKISDDASLEQIVHLAIRVNFQGSRSACGRDSARLIVPNHFGKLVTTYVAAKRTTDRTKVTCAECKTILNI
jgi:hypothetical protein